MLFYNIYYKTEGDSSTLEFEVTCGDSMYGLHLGTKEWMEKALKAMNIYSGFTKWEITPFRCAYVSEYFDYSKGNWKDRFHECWNVKIWLNENITNYRNKLDDIPKQGTNYIDETYLEIMDLQENGIEACNQNALIITDYKLKEEEVQAKLDELIQIINRYTQEQNQIEVRSFDYDIYQYRVFMKDKTVPDSLTVIEQLLQEIEQDGGVVNFHQRFGKFGVSFLDS